jgi:Zinc finger, C2H2 type
MVNAIKCLLCNRPFSAEVTFRQHMRRVHQLFPCWHCSHQAKTETDLKIHNRSHSQAYQRVISVLKDVKDKIFVRDNLF